MASYANPPWCAQLIRMIDNSMRFTGAPHDALEPLVRLRHAAESRETHWFNDSTNFLEATRTVLGARDQIYSELSGTVELWQSASESATEVVTRMQRIAELLAREEQHAQALDMLLLCNDWMKRKQLGSGLLGEAARRHLDDVLMSEKGLGADEAEAVRLLEIGALLIDDRVTPPWAGPLVELGQRLHRMQPDEPTVLHVLMRLVRERLHDTFGDERRSAAGAAVLVYVKNEGWRSATVVGPAEIVDAKGKGGKPAAGFEVELLTGKRHVAASKDVLVGQAGGAGELLRESAAMGCEPMTRKLLELGVQPWEADLRAHTALHRAAKNGHAAVCELLLRNGADWKLRDMMDHRP